MPKREPTSAEYDHLLQENDALRLQLARLHSARCHAGGRGGLGPVSDLSDSIYPIMHCNVEGRDEIVRAPPHKSVCFIITGRKHADKIRASVAERRRIAVAGTLSVGRSRRAA